MKHQFTREEAQRIFADAAERQHTSHRETNEQLTLEELEQAAAAAGIDPAYIRAAAESLVRPGRGDVDKKLMGIPVQLRRSIVLPYRIGDEQWGEIVVELRQIFKNHGLATDVGHIREWVSDTTDRTPIRVTAEPEGDQTRFTIERSTQSRVVGFAVGTSTIILTSLLLYGFSIAGPAGDIWIPATVMLFMGLMFAASLVTGSRMTTRRDSARFDEVLRRVSRIGELHPTTEKEPLKSSEPLLELGEPESEELESRRRTRTRGR